LAFRAGRADDVEPIPKGDARFGDLVCIARHQQRPGVLRNAAEHRVERHERIARKVHLRDQP
jgi:hypothetical protein